MKTQTKKIPEGWEEMKLGDVANIINGGTPRTSVNKYWDGGVPWITPRDLSNYKNIYISKGERNISAEGLEKSSARLVPKGSILLTSRAPIGYVVIAKNTISTNQGFKSLVLHPDITHNIYFYYWLKNNVDYLKTLGTGSTFLEISKNSIQKITISLPPLPEQRRIADILSAVDEYIEVTREVVETSERLKKGLMQKLFIKKRGWKEMKLGDVANIINGGTPRTSVNKYWDGGVPWITPRDLSNYKNIYISKGERNISAEGLEKSSARLVPKGSILLTSRAPIGYVVIAKNTISTNQGFKSLVLHPDITHNIYFYYWLKNNVDYLKTLGTGSTFLEISKNSIQKITISLPPLPEQRRIADILSAVDEKVIINREKVQKLEVLKKGLMQDLLSGKKRVCV